MPEQPDVDAYIAALRPLVSGRALVRVRLLNPFLLRSVDPPISDADGREVLGLRRLGKRVVISLRGDLHLVVHLMIAGRFLWREKSAKPPGRISQAVFEFDNGALILTEAGTKRRASLHLEQGEAALARHDPGGAELLSIDNSDFSRRLRQRNCTLKRALTDPHVFAGVGNAYSDEILHAARLSPIQLTGRLSDADCVQLLEAARHTLTVWTQRLTDQFRRKFPGPGDVTAFRDDFAVHGRFGLPCPDCGKPVQRIRYAENETNYCAQCQTGGKVLADRSLSRLLKDDWPRNIDEWDSPLA